MSEAIPEGTERDAIPDAPSKRRNPLELGNLTAREKAKDFLALFILTFILTRYLTPTAITIMFGSALVFHLAQNLTYREEPPPGLNSLHLKYFVGTYLLCVGYLLAHRMYRTRFPRRVQHARLSTRYPPGYVPPSPDSADQRPSADDRRGTLAGRTGPGSPRPRRRGKSASPNSSAPMSRSPRMEAMLRAFDFDRSAAPSYDETDDDDIELEVDDTDLDDLEGNSDDDIEEEDRVTDRQDTSRPSRKSKK